AYMRATGRTRPLAVAGAASMITFVVLGLPLLVAYGLPGLAAGIALQVAANLVCRAYYLRKLFHGFDYLRHAARAIVPTIPAVAAVLAMRALESGQRTLGMAAAELGVYLAVTAAATWCAEHGVQRGLVGPRQRVGDARVRDDFRHRVVAAQLVQVQQQDAAVEERLLELQRLRERDVPALPDVRDGPEVVVAEVDRPKGF